MSGEIRGTGSAGVDGRWVRAAVALVVAGGLTACIQEGGDAGSAPATTTRSAASTEPSVSPTPDPSAAAASPGVDEAEAELQAYLDAWRTQGPAAAGRTYLTPDQQVTADTDAPHLRGGTVVRVTPQPSDTAPVYLATLRLSFDGDPVAWTEGTNERFVTFTPRAGAIHYAMTFATSP